MPTIIEPFKNITNPWQSSLDSWQLSINAYLKAIREHTPELFKTITHDSVCSSLLARILELQNDLNMSPKTEAEINKVYEELNKDLADKMPELLHRFAEALLAKKEKELERFSSKIGDLYLAALIDNTGRKDLPHTVELVEELSRLVDSKDFPQKYKEAFNFIIQSLTNFPYSLECAQAALEEIKTIIESARTHADEIITSNLQTEETIKKLIEELSDEFYISNFIALFKLFKFYHQDNQAQRAAIEARIKRLELHYPDCKKLKLLISTWRKELDELEFTALKDRTKDNVGKLSQQLGEFKDKLERGDYFQQAKQAISSYLTLWEDKIKHTLTKGREYLKELASRSDNSDLEAIHQTDEKLQSESREIEGLLKSYKDHHSKSQSFSEILALEENIVKKAKDKYTTRYELQEYWLVDDILDDILKAGTIKRVSVKKIKDLLIEDSTLKSLSYKLFFKLKAAVSYQQQIDYFKNLNKFFETKEVQDSETADRFLLFKQALRNVITEKFLEGLPQPDDSLKEVCEFFKDEINAIVPLKPEVKEWFNTVKETIDAFERYKLDLDKIKNSYAPTLFLISGDSKKLAVERLKQRVDELPLKTTPEQLKKVFDEWEKDFGRDIDAQRYKFDLVKNLMNIFHHIQMLFSDKKITTKTRMFVNNIKEQTQIMLETDYQAPTSRRM